MRIFWVILATAVAWSQAAMAETVIVKTGDHPGFTRVVLHLPSEMQWTTREKERGLAIDFSGDKPDFDLQGIFSRIGRERVSDVRPAANGLEISFGCDCTAKAHASGQQMVVVDVGLAEKSQRDPPTQSVLPDPAKVLARTKNDPVPAEFKAELGVESQNSATVDQKLAKQRLFKQLGRAASMGLVDLSVADSKVDEQAVSVDERASLGTEDTNVFAHHAGVAAYPALSAEVESETPVDKVSESGLDCPTDAILQTGQWGQGNDFSSGLQQLRLRLGGEISPVDQQVALEMMRHYLAYGFGAEALILRPYVGSHADVEWLTLIAKIVDEMPVPETYTHERFSSCDSAIGLWTLLASPPNEVHGVLDAAPFLRAFSDLNPPLQNLLAPRIGAIFLAAQEEEAAQTVLRIVERQVPSETANLSHLGAQIQMEAGETDRAKQMLAESVQAEAPISPLALVELIESEIHRGRSISPETVDLLASYYQQHRRDAIAPRLLQVLILANALAGQFDVSWDLLMRSTETVSDTESVRSGFASALATHGSNLDVARFGAILSAKPDKLTGAANMQMAKRLLRLGFPDLADRFLSIPADSADEHARKLLLAKMALERNEFIAAKTYLLGMAGPDVETLLARIDRADSHAVPLGQNKQAPDEEKLPSLKASQAALSQSQALRDQLRLALSELSVR